MTIKEIMKRFKQRDDTGIPSILYESGETNIGIDIPIYMGRRIVDQGLLVWSMDYEGFVLPEGDKK